MAALSRESSAKASRGTPAVELAFTTGYETTAVRAGRYKLVHIGFSQIGDVPAWIGEYGFKLYDLESDPGELQSQVPAKGDPGEGLREWMRVVYAGLSNLDARPPVPLDEESVKQLRSLGYAD